MSANWVLHCISFFAIGFMIIQVEAGTGLYTGPYFPTPQPKNVTVHQNTIAYLPCAVKQLGDRSVSWVRQRDADILTVDRYTFVSDERFTVHYVQETGTWTLVIKFVQERDAGIYECQISTEPKMSRIVHLNVIVPRVEIVGALDKYVRKGSTAKLECRVSSTVQLPDYIFWYHSGQRLLEYDHPRISITVDRNGEKGKGDVSVTSSLVISNAMESDDGNYTCLPSNLASATTRLHVLNDEHPAAMQTGAAMLTNPPSWHGVLLVVVLAFIFAHFHQEWQLISEDFTANRLRGAKALHNASDTKPMPGSDKYKGFPGSTSMAYTESVLWKPPFIRVIVANPGDKCSLIEFENIDKTFASTHSLSHTSLFELVSNFSLLGSDYCMGVVAGNGKETM